MAFSFKLSVAPIVLITIFLALGFTLSVTLPFATGPDEVAHFRFTRFIAKYGRLPTTPEERAEAGYKSDLPPLFHTLVGLAGRGIDFTSPPYVKVTQNNPRLQLVVGVSNVLGWRAITTEDPYQGEVLLWYLGRWLALVSGAVGIGVTYLLVRGFYPNSPWLALSAAALLAFIPTYIHTSSVTSYESLLGALLALYFLLLFYVLHYPDRAWFYLTLGLLLGGAVLTKYTPLPLIPALPLFILWLAIHHKWTWRLACRRLILAGAGLALTLGNWLIFTEIYFNQVAKQGWVRGLLSPFLGSDGSDETSLRLAGFISGGEFGIIGSSHKGDSFVDWAWNFIDGMWGGSWLTWLFLGVWSIALIGLMSQWLRLHWFKRSLRAAHLSPALQNLEKEPTGQIARQWIILLLIHLGLLTLLPLLRFLMTRDAITGMGQHLLFPAGAILILLLVYGLSAWLTPPRLTVALLVMAGLCLGRSTFLGIEEYSPAWPIQTVPVSESEQVLATFAGMSLIGYNHTVTDQTLITTLQWRTEALIDEDYRLELTLLDAMGQPQIHWLGQPLNGRYPTRAWMPGDRIRDDILLYVAGLPPGDYQVQLRGLGETGPITPVVTSTLKTVGPSSSPPISGEEGSLNLGSVVLAPAPALAVETVQLNNREIGYTLWPSAYFSTAKPPLYEENATIVVSTRECLPDEIHLSLVGPDRQPHAPVDQLGCTYSFSVEPQWASGDYHLRFEQGDNADRVGRAETASLLRFRTEKRQFQLEPVSHPVQANFAGQVALLGYDLPERRVQPGESLPVTLHWQALKTMGADLIMFNHLIGSDQKIWGGRDRRAREVYSTMLWAPGEIVSDSFGVQVAPDTPAGIYNLLVGVYLPVGQAAVSLPLLQEGRMTDLTNINLGMVKVGRTLPGFTVETGNPQKPVNQPFGGEPNVTLLGYDFKPSSVDNCQLTTGNCQLSITLYWRSESPLPLDYTTFVHLRKAGGDTVAQKDQPPLNGAYPTSLWDPGEIIADMMDLPLPAALADGSYQIVVGLYDLQTGQRLTVPGNPANEVQLTDVEIR